MAENLYMFGIKDDQVSIACPECGESSGRDEWQDVIIDCDLCGEHSALSCPKCDEIFDIAYDGSRFKAAQTAKERHAEA